MSISERSHLTTSTSISSTPRNRKRSIDLIQWNYLDGCTALSLLAQSSAMSGPQLT